MLSHVCYYCFVESEELFGKALKDGSVSVSIVNTLILGEAGVGKTSTKCILFDDPLPKDRTSTPLAEAPLQVQVDSPKIPKNVSEIKVQSIANRWKALSDKQLQEIVADAVAAISVKTTSTKQYLDQLTSPTSVHGTQPQPNQTERSSLSVARPITISNIKKEIVVTTAEGDFIAPSSCLELTSWIGSNWTLTIDVDETCQFRNILPQLSDKVEASASDDKRSEKTASASDSLPETGKRAKDSSGSTVVSELYSTPVKDSFETVVANIRTKIIDLINEKKRKMLYQVLVPNEIFGSKWIYFTDSGGQPHFHNLLPHFVRGISVALFVHRLCRKLEECPMVEYYEDGQPITAPYQSSYSTGDTLKCLVRSMQSQTIKNKKPRLVFVGTFLDEIEESGENLSEKNKKLLTLLSPEFMDQLVFCTEHLKELIFSMNAKTPGIHEEEVAEKIRAVVESSPSRKIDIPIWWYVLEVTLKNLSAHLDRMVLSKQECLVVAQQLSISNDALVEALKFFHYQHIFLYYSDILPDVVFTSPQVLLDKLTELVKEAYLMRGSSSATNSSSAPRSGSWHKFRDQGILVLDFLEQFKLHYSNLFTPPDLLKIFMRHLIITPLSSDDFCQVNDFSSRFIQYYMPSLLNMLSFNELESHRVNTLRVADPLLIRFPNGWPRAGVFCCLQVYLIQQLHWKLLYKEGKPKLIAQNCVMLSPPKSSCIVTLIDSFSYFEIHVNADSDVCQKVCPLIESHIKSGIEASCRTLNYSSDEPHLAFFCSCHLTSSTGGGAPQRHVAELLKDDGCLRCSIDETVTYKMETKYTIWFQESCKCTLMFFEMFA